MLLLFYQSGGKPTGHATDGQAEMRLPHKWYIPHISNMCNKGI